MDLAEEILKLNRSYYDDGESSLSDDEYDAILDFARSKGIDISTLTPPEESSGWQMADHISDMSGIPRTVRNLSEWKAISSSESVLNGFASLKYDGLAVELQYDEHGNLVAAVLRGDGLHGENVIRNMMMCGGVPKKIPKTTRWVKGELVVSFNNLKMLNEIRNDDGLPPYKSPRGAVALIRSKRANVHQLGLLKFRPISCDGPRPQDEQLSLLSSMDVGFDPIDVTESSPAGSWMIRNRAESERDSWQYLLDGIVHRCHDGRMFKLKFDPSAAVTEVTAVVEQLGRTGIISPVCEFEPVELCGATVRRATAHNPELISNRLSGLGIGSKILVSRRGDVIPHVERVVEASDDPWTPGTACPSCGAKCVRDGAFIRCSSDPSDCPGTTLGLMVKYCMELGLKGLGRGVISAMVSAGIATPADLYLIDSEIIASLPMPGGQRIGHARASEIIDELHAKMAVRWSDLLGAVGIPRCAKQVMASVAERFGSYDELASAGSEELMKLDDVGPTRADAIASWMDSRGVDILQPLTEILHVVYETSGPLSGKTFCITLGLTSGSRQEVEARIKAAGGVCKGSVSRHVTHLVCNFPDETTEKLKHARRLGIPIISESELFEMMGSAIECDDEAAPDDEF